MTRDELHTVMDKVFDECRGLREAGQKEYARSEENAFANFERVAAELGISREAALWVYLLKHKDGVASWINGHRSQRENVRGRINDMIVYLCILRGMIEESEAQLNIDAPIITAGDIWRANSGTPIRFTSGNFPSGGL